LKVPDTTFGSALKEDETSVKILQTGPVLTGGEAAVSARGVWWSRLVAKAGMSQENYQTPGSKAETSLLLCQV